MKSNKEIKEKKEPLERKVNLKVVGRWDKLEYAKIPSKVRNLIEIAEWNGISPNEHLWVHFLNKTANTSLITDSDLIIQLSEILKMIKKNPKLLEKGYLLELIEW